MAEEDPDEGLNASRVAPAVFSLEAFNVLGFELKEIFSLLIGQKISRRRCTLFLGSFIEALGVCVSDGGPSTDTPRHFALLVLRNSLRLGSRRSLFDGLDSLFVGSILGRSWR